MSQKGRPACTALWGKRLCNDFTASILLHPQKLRDAEKTLFFFMPVPVVRAHSPEAGQEKASKKDKFVNFYIKKKV